MFYELSHISSTDYFKKIYCEDFSFPPHMHNCFELVVCFSGEMKITVDETTYTVEAGESVFIFPHQLHSFDFSESKHMICIFSPKLVSAYFNPRSALKPTNNKFTLEQPLISALDGYNGDSEPLFIKGLLYLICNTFNSSAKYTENRNKGLLEKIFIFINENFTRDCSLKAVAVNMGYNASYISRYFKNCVGINLCDYVNMVRLSNVCYLYENTNATILSLALDSGFDSLRTFNRNFKKFYGVSPKEFFKNNSTEQHDTFNKRRAGSIRLLNLRNE